MAEAAIPILQRGRLSRNRKYGRYDFERFDHLSSAHASIGHNTFDKVTVNCRFLFKKSRWGVLGLHKHPAGIIYLDLSFDQPKDSQLDSATVIITLEDEDKGLLKSNNNSLSKTLYPVQITDYFGPKGFAGPAKTAQIKKSLHLTPNAQFAGTGFGGIGFDHEASSTSSSRWKFSGTLLPGKGTHQFPWAYRTLKWDLTENDLESQATHSNVVHTAFAFEHSGQPFFMKVEIKGKLKRRHERVRDKLMKFPSSVNRDDASIVTRINFGDLISFRTPLDERAQNLQFEMELANMHEIPMEVSDPKPATFFSFLQNPRTNGVPGTQGLSQSSSRPQSGISNGVQYELPSPIQIHQLEDLEELSLPDTARNVSTADLAQTFLNLQKLDQQPFQRVERAGVGSEVLFANETEILRANREIPKNIRPGATISEHEIILQILKIPMILMLLRFIAGLVTLFSRKAIVASELEEERRHPIAPTRDLRLNKLEESEEHLGSTERPIGAELNA
jgi:hypothetical protein